MADITFKLSVLNAQALIYSAEVKSLILTGDEAEYELLPYHAPLMGVLKKSEIIIDHKLAIPILKGLVKFYDNTCYILAEEILVKDVEGFEQPEVIEKDEN